MSFSRLVALPRILSRQELRAFVEAEGGTWQDDPTLPQGAIVKGSVWLFLRGVDRQEDNLSQLSSDEISQAEKAAGAPILGAISVDHTKGDEGNVLAVAICRKMIAKWGGAAFSE